MIGQLTPRDDGIWVVTDDGAEHGPFSSFTALGQHCRAHNIDLQEESSAE